MTVNFYLDKKSNKTEKTIFMYIRGIGKTIVIHTGERIDPKLWDRKRQIAKKSYVGSPELNTYLNYLREKVKREYRLIVSEDTKSELSNDVIRDAIKNLFQKPKNIDSAQLFYDALDRFICVRGTDRRVRTLKKYRTLMQHLKEFQKANQFELSFTNINMKFFELFTSFLMKNLNHTNNTIGKYISTLKSFLNWAVEHKMCKNIEYRKFKVYQEKSDITALTEEELFSIYNLGLSNNTTLEKVRDVFCFGCFTGQRFSDIVNLQRKDIRASTWALHSYKTKDHLLIPLNLFASAILDKYKNNENPLPIISHQKTNMYIKEICKLAKIDEILTVVKYRGAERIETTAPKYNFITTHTARRTFVTLSLEKGMRPETLMEITGHKDYKTFKRYIKITSKVKEIEMNNTWNINNISDSKKMIELSLN